MAMASPSTPVDGETAVATVAAAAEGEVKTLLADCLVLTEAHSLCMQATILMDDVDDKLRLDHPKLLQMTQLANLNEDLVTTMDSIRSVMDRLAQAREIVDQQIIACAGRKSSESMTSTSTSFGNSEGQGQSEVEGGEAD